MEVYGILQARILEWVEFPFSRGSSQPRDPTQVSHVCREISNPVRGIQISPSVSFRLTSCYFSLWCLSFIHNTCVCSVAQLCRTFCYPMDCRPPGSSVQGIFQARILKRVAISYSRGSSWSRDWTSISCLSCTGRWILYHCATWETLNTWFQFITLTLAVL